VALNVGCSYWTMQCLLLRSCGFECQLQLLHDVGPDVDVLFARQLWEVNADMLSNKLPATTGLKSHVPQFVSTTDICSSLKCLHRLRDVFEFFFAFLLCSLTFFR